MQYCYLLFKTSVRASLELTAWAHVMALMLVLLGFDWVEAHAAMTSAVREKKKKIQLFSLFVQFDAHT